MRDLKRCIYTSSYDRGIQHLLEMWPDVIKKEPKATLHIFYGWQLFDRFYQNNPASMDWKKRMVKMMNQKGVKEYGRLSQDKLIAEYKKSGIFAYPTHFGEINCISAIKAQAYGCEPVVINYAALTQTVKYGKKVDGDIYDQETKDAYLKTLLEALQSPMSEDKRKEMMKWARNKYEWSVIAKEWDKEFRG